ncbi:cellulase family glycosylhydrolase [Pseudonocardia sp. KRD-184]|uniref:Cellulase family glycosylhydrolase n=1 Tax=Pseudonocardia oceani TaxID=2792013 RepID=A0ABS6U5F2_9PSEU|nr:cellulase family glycosylhydrolase [Pseudonocardia oceani]MBW0091960.1 cellulase family glycosylhydrolase [Pseudonocardia oceani]MBW0099032.1 cellulase family glycosylhydrolase [Pseudonocardia oceani]MBW0125233.1 cellulase family glycosylhydrolase [Pseudonocardia oceani]MBW0127455.1 cellulase family glycosylhydrolase [Pseudonocardia oceani]
MSDAPGRDPSTTPLRVTPPAGGRRRRLVIGAGVALLVVIGVVTAVIVSQGPSPSGGSGAPPAADGLGTDVPITVDGDRILRNGQPWWLLGYNSFVWSGNCGDEDERMSAEDVDAWFASMRHDGRGAVRLFFFESWDLDRLDAAVESAKRHDVYLTITLDDAIGGCGETDKDSSWFEDQDERDAFRAHMTSLLERYRGETTIAWFEYFNEPSYEGGALREFYDEMGAAADEVDPDRLFATGTIAPYAVGDDADFTTLNESPGVDIASMHEYDENEVESNHGPDVRAGSAGKPVIVGEFGLYASESGEDCERDFAERTEQARLKAEAYTTGAGYAGAMMWAWQPGPENASECEYGNLDVDPLVQEMLRTFTP